VDEAPLKAGWLAEGATPAQVAAWLADAKAAAAVDGSAWVIGADQTAEFDGRLLDKADFDRERWSGCGPCAGGRTSCIRR
jgi:predicted house-cleaning NTP pyrophosphatase (Maf/HAM1 superfamily)